MLFCDSKSDICNFADDITLSSSGKMLGDILRNLKFDLGHILKWFKVNLLKPYPGKFQFMTLGTNTHIKVNIFLDGNKQPVLLWAINLDVFREIINLKSTKNPFSVATSGS